MAASLFPSRLLTAQNVLHPSSPSGRAGGKSCFFLERVNLLQPLCSRSSEGCTCFNLSQLWPRVTVWLLSRRRYFALNQEDSQKRSEIYLRRTGGLPVTRTAWRVNVSKTCRESLQMKPLEAFSCVPFPAILKHVECLTANRFFFSSFCPSLRRLSEKQQRCGPAPCLEEEEEAPGERSLETETPHTHIHTHTHTHTQREREREKWDRSS